MKRRIVSIKFRLIALGVALCLCGIALRTLVALPRFQGHVEELVASQQLAIASEAARDVAHSLAARHALVRRLGADLSPALLRDGPALSAWLAERQHINPLFNGGLLVIGADGAKLAAAGQDVRLAVGQHVGDAVWLAQSLAAPETVLSRPLRLGAGAAPALLFTVALRGADGRAQALLAGVALPGRPGFLDDLLPDSHKDGKSDTKGLLLISPADRLFIGASDADLVLRPTPPAGVNPLHDRAMGGYRGTGLTTNAKGVEEFSAIVAVPDSAWFVVARIPAEQAFRPVREMRSFMFLGSLATLALLLAVLLLALSHILRPLISAARAIEAMADGRRELTILPIVRKDEVGKLVKVFNILVERLHKEEAARLDSEAKLLHLAHHDSLTGLHNRAMLESRLEQEVARCERGGAQMALMFCDLDGFKAINDAHGHRCGDAVLREVARRLEAQRRRIDTVARLGGDEFVILLADLTDARAGAARVARTCMDELARPFEIDGKQLSLGVSIGIAVHAGAGLTPAQMLSQADKAMYQAKRQGKGRFCFLDPLEPLAAPVSDCFL